MSGVPPVMAICGGKASASSDSATIAMWVVFVVAVIGGAIGVVDAAGNLEQVLEKLDEALGAIGNAVNDVFNFFFNFFGFDIQGILADIFTLVSTDPTDLGLVFIGGVAGFAATEAVIVIFVINRCTEPAGRNATSSGVAETVTPAFNGFWNTVFPFTSYHPQVDVVVISANWEQTQWGAATFIRCAPCDNCPADVRSQHPIGGCSPELAYFFHSARVCAAGAGAITGGAIGGVVGIILGVLGGIAATGGCGFAALACIALAVIVSIIIAAGSTLIGASIGGTIGRYRVSNDEDPTAPGPGDATMTISAGDYLTASGNLITTAFVNNANAYWFVGFGVDDQGNVTDMRTPDNPGIMKHGRSKQALAPYCYTDPNAQTF
jgi:hypothetical protein